MNTATRCLAVGMLGVASLAGPGLVVSAGPGAQTSNQRSLLLAVDITASAWTKLTAASTADARADPRVIGQSYPKITRSERLRVSVEEHFIAKLAAGTRGRIGLGSHRLTLGDQFTDDRGHLARSWRALLAINREEHAGPSRIWDVAARAVQVLASEPGTRTLILITDGYATGNRLTPDDVIGAAREHSVVIHVVSLALDREVLQREGHSVFVRSNAALRRIAEATGGEFLSQEGPQILRWGTSSGPTGWDQPSGRRWVNPGEPLDELMKRIRDSR